MHTVRIRAFGTPGVSFGRGAWLRQKTRASELLLGYLALNGKRSHHREKLAAMLWPDADPHRSRNAFRTTIWRLRKQLEPHEDQRGTILRVEPNGNVGLNWDNGIWCDVCAFREAFDARRTAPASEKSTHWQGFRDAIDLYRGELMESFHEDWILIEREALRSAYLTGLDALMRAAQSAGDPATALEYGRAILVEDPLHETIHRRMIALYLQSGDRAQALRQYDICAQAIKAELGIEPMAETRALHGQILIGSPDPLNAQDGLAADLHLAVQRVQEALCGLEVARSRYVARASAKSKQSDPVG